MTILIARVAIALMALHILDDSFLQPANGTSAGDHLVSGLVPLAGLAAAAWGFGRVRPGARVVLAFLLAPLGIVLGAEAIYYMRHGGLSGDDFTGLLAIPAGAALIGIGAVTLWTSRRLDDSRYWRYPRRALIAGAGLLGLLSVSAPIAMSYGFTHITRAEVPAADLRTAYEDVTLTTADGLKLAGWYIPSRNGAAVMVYPGRKTAQKHARYLSSRGYGVLLVDRRGEGDSEGEPHTFGWTFDEDIKAGVEFLEQRSDVEPGRIGGLGLSVGGEMMLQTAADTKGLAAVVSDGAGARVMSEEMADISGFDRILGAPLYAVKTAATAVFSNRNPPSNLVDYIARIGPRPIMLIHAAKGEVDNKTPEYLAAATGPAEDWEVPKGGHTQGIHTMPEEYGRRVAGFFDRTLAR
jgi:hypothetical protein